MLYMANTNISGKKTIESDKAKKENMPSTDVMENKSSIMEAPLEENMQLSYFEKQVLKELKSIRKASKNILKVLKKSNI